MIRNYLLFPLLYIYTRLYIRNFVILYRMCEIKIFCTKLIYFINNIDNHFISLVYPD